MPDPGSHAFDVKRTRKRAYDDEHLAPDQHADRAAAEELERDYPPRLVDDQTGRAAGPAGGGDNLTNPSADAPERTPSGGVALRSSAFTDHSYLAERHARQGENRPPPLEWTHVPSGAREFALVCTDPDAPGADFVHWIVTGIPASASGLDEGVLPDGASAGRNDFGGLGWDGPQPPVGDEPHRYFFRLHVSDSPLQLGEGASAGDLASALRDHEIARGTLVGLFAR